MGTNCFSLDGMLAVVTGGGRGLGFEIAKAMAASGARIVIGGRKVEALERAAQTLRQSAPTECQRLDVASEESIDRFDRWIAKRCGPADVLVNCAGISPHAQMPQNLTTTQWLEVLQVNLTGTFLCCRAFGRRMLERGSGSIINISSIAGVVGLSRGAAYCASKGGVEMLTRSLALDWAASGVRVNAIAPGIFDTDMSDGIIDSPKLSERALAKTPMRRFGAPSEVAGAAVFLASPASSFVTGHSLIVDGGWTAA
ncbi:MAG: short-chain dehydrogenase [Alphaproteobacteria bacterium]|nr:MAG: short-chain dehydrogenase [Alphaproteobacteria bacterium]